MGDRHDYEATIERLVKERDEARADRDALWQAAHGMLQAAPGFRIAAQRRLRAVLDGRGGVGVMGDPL